MKTCFIVCPIGNEGSETRKRSDTLLNYVLKPVCIDCGFKAIRVDELNTGNSISQSIVDHLKTADLVIADLTEHNPNAFYELGYRTALGKPTIQIKSKGESLPFDVTTIQTFDYNLTDLAEIDSFKNRIKQTIQSYCFDQSDDCDDNTDKPSSNFNAVILQEIYKLQDMVNGLSDRLTETDTTAISVLADKLSQANVKTPETALIETLLPAMLQNPDSFMRLVELSKNVK